MLTLQINLKEKQTNKIQFLYPNYMGLVEYREDCTNPVPKEFTV